MLIYRAAGFAVLCLAFWSATAAAQDVTLASRDGTVRISGTLLGYDGEFYRVDTIYGELTLDGSGVICEGPGCPDLEAFVAEFDVSGARTIGAVLMPALIEAFSARNGYLPERVVADDSNFSYHLVDRRTAVPAAHILFRVTSTSEGFADLLADEADLVLALREADTKEAQLVSEAGQGDLTDPRRSRIVALDALVPLVSSRNSIRDISVADLAAVFAGHITNWSELGGADVPIHLHLRDENSGLAQVFFDRVLRPSQLDLAVQINRHASNEDLSDAVARDPGAIGIGSYSEIGNSRALALRGACGIVSRATDVSVKTEDYPLNAPLFIYTPARRLPLLAREFLAYVRSPAAQPVIRRAGFVDQRMDRIALAEQGERLANAIVAAGEDIALPELQRMVKLMRASERLTLTFRFRAGGTTLDAQSLSNVSILGRILESGALNGQTVSFVGFTDGDGSAQGNMRLARRRALAVREAVLQAAPAADRAKLVLRVEAFGEALPMACDEEAWGRQINRRVEVWVGQR